ncbi:hypothetical protein A4G16_02190 [Mannheimia granulomatis]|uniref:DUF4376 domain-containing protein n=1 Tax=Mannheimia granulomatis TaxID=85402 RepID=A0A6G8JGR0_9PAST|nr:DUF4376 domain-containing protein [Mannheimia granulomatis]QIM66266.1 hypothetical protein A4G16_02190 [Mannheimia granulomatis]
MRVFLNDLKILSTITKKEEITEHTFLVTDQEAEKLQETIDSDGFFWSIDKYTIGCSGACPSHIHKWNEELKEWQICPELKAIKHKKDLDALWEILKNKIDEHSKTGVLVNGYWWHTDSVSRTKYDDLSRLVLLGEELAEEWSTMTGEVVILDNELFKQLSRGIYAKTKQDYNNAKRLLALAEKLDKPLEQDITNGWSEAYKSTRD